MKLQTKLLYLIGALLLIGLTVYSILKQNTNSTINTNETAFAVADTGSIDKIILSRKDGRLNVLTRVNNEWKINNSTIAAPILMKMLLRTIHDIDIRRPINPEERDPILKKMAGNHTKVNIYSNGLLIKSYFIGPDTDEERGTIFLMDGSEMPYVVHLPGFDGILNPRYDVKEATWRTKLIFRTDARILRSVKVEHLKNPKETLELKHLDGAVTIPALGRYDTVKAEIFLQHLVTIGVEQFLLDLPIDVKDSLLQTQPEYKISITNYSPKEDETLRIYEAPKGGERTYAYLEKKKAWAIMQTEAVAKMAIPKSALVAK